MGSSHLSAVAMFVVLSNLVVALEGRWFVCSVSSVCSLCSVCSVQFEKEGNNYLFAVLSN